jgi:SAM-dependent methyltransferase
MKARRSDWYKHGWDLDIKKQSWVENTENEVSFIIEKLDLQGNERILDLACGYGRHALLFAEKGYSVVGVDITPAYIEDARQEVKTRNLAAAFLLSDIREVTFFNEFDVVLNLADGAIGYLENDSENLKIFDVISRALKQGGKHFMDIGNAEHAEHYFPKKFWDVGEQAISLAAFEWDPNTRTMLFGGCDIPYGQPAKKPEIPEGDPTRLYSLDELKEIFRQRNMVIQDSWCSYRGDPSIYKEYQLMIYSIKKS